MWDLFVVTVTLWTNATLSSPHSHIIAALRSRYFIIKKQFTEFSMSNVLGFLEAKLMPLAAKAAQQRHLCAIRGAYVSFMPFIIVGSVLLIISSFPSQSYQQFMAGMFAQRGATSLKSRLTPSSRPCRCSSVFWSLIGSRSTMKKIAYPAAF